MSQTSAGDGNRATVMLLFIQLCTQPILNTVNVQNKRNSKISTACSGAAKCLVLKLILFLGRAIHKTAWSRYLTWKMQYLFNLNFKATKVILCKYCSTEVEKIMSSPKYKYNDWKLCSPNSLAESLRNEMEMQRKRMSCVDLFSYRDPIVSTGQMTPKYWAVKMHLCVFRHSVKME